MTIVRAMMAMLVAAPLAAQAPRDFSLLRRGVDSMAIILVRNGDELPVGEMWDELRDTTAGGPALKRIYRTRNSLFGPHIETTTVALPKLEIRSTHSTSRYASATIELAGDSLLGWRMVQDRRMPIARASPAAIDAAMFDLLLRASPLAPGFRLEVPAFISVRDTVALLVGTVRGSEPVAQRDGTSAECWVVDGDFAGLSVTFWIDKQSRVLVKQIIRLTPTAAMLMRR